MTRAQRRYLQKLGDKVSDSATACGKDCDCPAFVAGPSSGEKKL